jgi:hypothetical protein
MENLERMTKFIVTIFNDVGYSLEADRHCINHNLSPEEREKIGEDFSHFEQSWTFPNALLFTMTTLTLIGEKTDIW